MDEEKKIGRPPRPPTEEEIANLLEYVRHDLAQYVAAWRSGVHPDTLTRWLEEGMEDIKADLDTPMAAFTRNFRKNQSIKISELLAKIETGTKNWQALAWRLEACVKEEFGKTSEEYKKLLEVVSKLVEDTKRRIDDPLQGAKLNGEEIHKESDQTSRSLTQGTGNQERQENPGENPE